MGNLQMKSVNIIDKVSADEGVEDHCAPDAIDLGQVEVVADTPDNLGITQHMAVMLPVF